MSGCRGEVEANDEIPRVFVWCVGEQIPEIVQYLEHGIEEEGVSWLVKGGYDGKSVSIAHEAALDSSLKIGISVTPDTRVVVHHKQLPNDEPMFDVAGVAPETARKLGSNSARLAKGTPLKPIGKS
jgi:hypothetical protein